jgi:hypothetical protein
MDAFKNATALFENTIAWKRNVKEHVRSATEFEDIP